MCEHTHNTKTINLSKNVFFPLFFDGRAKQIALVFIHLHMLNAQV